MTHIFNECYPQFAMKEETFGRIFADSVFIGDDTGFAAVSGVDIRVICVSPECRGRGIGTRLLTEAERLIRENGHDISRLGGTSSKFLIGADSSTWGFFERRGYIAKGQCDEMMLRLDGFDAARLGLHSGAQFGWYDGDIGRLHKAVASVNEEWVKYFGEGDKTYTAIVDGEIASFCQVDTDAKVYLSDRYGRVGMPGCVGTVPEYRRRGIGIEMVARATDYLRRQGMDISFIYYTGVAEWYEKIGYRTFMTEIFAEKALTSGKQM